MKIIYCCFGRAGLECLYQLLNFGSLETEDLLVFTHESPENQELLAHLKNNKINYFTDSINKHEADVVRFEPDFLLSVYYQFLVKPPILKAVGYRAMNLHPALLPLYRGTKSSVWALLNNEECTGVSFHYMNDEFDDGNLILQEKMEIRPTDTAYSLYHKLIGVFVRNFHEALQSLISGHKGVAQSGPTSYYSRTLPFDGVREFSDVTEIEALQFIKALYFPPHKGASFRTPDGEIVEICTTVELQPYQSLLKSNDIHL